MKTSSHLIAAAAFAFAAVAGAHAESYQGVHPSISTLSRADVNAEAVRAAAAPDQNVTRGSRGADPFTSTADVNAVRAQAIATAAAPDQNVTSGSRVNSRVISTLQNPADVRLQAQRGAAQLK